MNHPLVIGRLGLLAVLMSLVMLGTALLFAALDLLRVRHDPDFTAIVALCAAGGLGLVVGGVAWWATRGARPFLGRREALLLVATSWLLGAAFAALPFWLWAHLGAAGEAHPFRSFADCYFEAMSGLTTTGASVLADVEAVPAGLLLWRAITHWLGGLGIVVLFVAVLPGLGVGGKRLFNVEAPGPSKEGLQPHIRETARRLWYIYLGLTVAMVALLWVLTPMDAFESVCHAFSALATGGFSTRNASIGAYHDTPWVDIIAILFMVLAGVNFRLFYQIRLGRWRDVLRDTELRVYLCLLALGSLLIAAALWWSDSPIILTTGERIASDAGASIRQGVFVATSTQTTTGFCTSDYNAWPFLAHAVIVLLMFIGGCSGSTSGGIKVIRLWVTLKILLAEVEHVFRPHVIRPLRLGRSVMDTDLKLGALAFVLGVILLFAAGSAAVMALEGLHPESACRYTTAATAAIACLFNVGPGLDQVGAIQHFGWLSAPSKAVLCLLMVLGRLEIFAIAVLLSPRFWRSD